MSTLQEIEAAVEMLPLEQKEELITFLRSRVTKQRAETLPVNGDLNSFSGVLQLREDPLEYQQRARGEW